MIYGFVYVEQENVRLFVIREPFLGKLDEASAIDENKQSDPLVAFTLLYFLL